MSALDNPLLSNSRKLSLGERGSFIIRILFQNVKSFLLPESLCHDWSSGTLHSINFPMLILPFILCLGMAYKNQNTIRWQHIKIWLKRIWDGKLKEKEFLLCWGAMTYFPISNIIPVGFIRAERCLYNLLPIYAWLLCDGIRQIELYYATNRKFSDIWKMIKYLCIGVLMTKSWLRSFDWRDDFNLALKASQAGSMKSRVNLAALLPGKQLDNQLENNEFERLKIGIKLIESVKYRNTKAGLQVALKSLVDKFSNQRTAFANHKRLNII